VVHAAFWDTVGCIVAGRRANATSLASQWADGGLPAGDDASVLLTSEKSSVRHAVFLNAVSAHAWELDDASFASHPSAVLVPVLWAEAERLGICGAAVVSAYLRSYQVWGELNRRTQDLHARGWHPTTVHGPIAAAAGVALLRGLDMPLIAHSLGIAASFAGGVVANFGTTTKPFQVGFAAERGVLAVDLAQAGVTAAPGALDGPGGLLRALGWSAKFPPMIDPLDLPSFHPTVKKYPICLASHRVVDGILDFATEIDHEDVSSVTATISASSAAVLEQGQTSAAGEAQFSLPFAVATGLIHGRVGLAEVDPHLLEDPKVRNLMNRVKIETTTSESLEESSFALADRVVITTKDGQHWDSGAIYHVRGSVKNPLRDGELATKVHACLEFGESDPARIEAIVAATDAMVGRSNTRGIA